VRNHGQRPARGADVVLDAVLAAAAHVFGQHVDPGEGFFSLGGDSIAAIELAADLEEQLDIDIDISFVHRADTFADLARLLADTAVSPTTRRTPANAVGPQADVGSHRMEEEAR
jgi:acyl carrier protein